MGCGSAVLSTPNAPGQLGESVPPTSVDNSMLCQGLVERFIGLPAMDPASTQLKDADGVAPSAGRWWVRKCRARAQGSVLEVGLEGPGWYWIDETSSGIRASQQVPFELSLAMRGRLRQAITGGILSLWFEVSGDPEVQVRSPPVLQVHGENAWGQFLSIVPGVSPGKRAAERFNSGFTVAFRESMRRGATFTIDLVSGQADATLGWLPPGKTPRRPFEDEPNWLVNDRLLLPPSSSQVLGPIEPGQVWLNVSVERGPGVAYRAICDKALQSSYAAIASGNLARVPSSAWMASGAMEGSGERTARLRVDGCKFYLVASTLKGLPTLASIRVSA
jgi:hypothetical protein